MITSTPRPDADNATPAPVTKRRHWPWIVTGIVVAVIAIGVAANAGKASSTVAAAAAAPVTVTSTVTKAPVTVTAQPSSASPACLKVIDAGDKLEADIKTLAGLGSDSVLAAFSHDTSTMNSLTGQIETLTTKVHADEAQLDQNEAACRNGN